MLSEDWLATLVGLALVLLVTLGIFGPGPQTVTVKVAAQEEASVEMLAASGWKLTATLNKEKATVDQAVTDISEGVQYIITCEAGQISMKEDLTVSLEKAQLSVVNHCDQPLEITYKKAAAVPWPLFGILDKKS